VNCQHLVQIAPDVRGLKQCGKPSTKRLGTGLWACAEHEKERRVYPPMMLENTAKLHYAFAKITFEEFSLILRNTLNAGPDYIEGCWPQFNSGYLGYCFSRQPIEQGEALFDLAMKKAGFES
jgi:hypothetical protein